MKIRIIELRAKTVINATKYFQKLSFVSTNFKYANSKIIGDMKYEKSRINERIFESVYAVERSKTGPK
ncbi:MAG: hypothetical protein ACPGLV_07150 [Bacteroidia bacterium]